MLKLADDVEIATTEALLGELFVNARLKADQGDYIDFRRVFRLQEEIYRFLTEKVGVAFSPPDTKQKLDRAWLERNRQLKAYLDNYRVSGAPLNYVGDANREVLKAILKFYAQDNRYINSCLAMLEKIERLAQLRNRTLIAHGFEGITREMIEASYPEGLTALLEHLRTLVEMVEGPISEREQFPVQICQEVKILLEELH